MRGIDRKRNRCVRLLTSKIRDDLNLNCVYFLPLSAPQSQGRQLQSIAWAAAIKTIGTSQERMAFMKRNLCIGAAFLALIAALGFGARVLEKKAAVEAATVQAPMFEVDPMWPKPLPNHWVIGMTIGVSAGCPGQYLDHSSWRLARSQGNIWRHESPRRGLLRNRAAGSRI